MKRTKSTFLALVAVLLAPMAVNADLIEITGTASSDGLWEITLLDSLYADSQALLESQEWWGDSDLARVFNQAVNVLFGVQNIVDEIGYGAIFLWAPPANDVFDDGWFYQFGGSTFDWACFGNVEAFCFPNPIYAIAQRVPEPGTLALFGIGLLGMAASRRRRKA